MVFLVDDGSVFDASLDEVWRFLERPDEHTRAHRHTATSRERSSPSSGRYSWRQEFEGRRVRFTMEWRSYYPLGIAYEVVVGPFAGSRFFLYYTPLGDRTGVTVVGEFVSGALDGPALERSVRGFFDLEFEQDQAALRRSRERTPRREDPGRRPEVLGPRR